MRTKKRVEIKKFNNFEINSNDVVVNNFYNYSPTRTLKNSSGLTYAGKKETKVSLKLSTSYLKSFKYNIK